jgi:hypothetical protein
MIWILSKIIRTILKPWWIPQNCRNLESYFQQKLALKQASRKMWKIELSLLNFSFNFTLKIKEKNNWKLILTHFYAFFLYCVILLTELLKGSFFKQFNNVTTYYFDVKDDFFDDSDSYFRDILEIITKWHIY